VPWPRTPLTATAVLTLSTAALVLAGSAPATGAATATGTPGASSASAESSASSAQLWIALGGRVTCGVAIHVPNTPPMQLLCSSPPVPAPKHGGIGDPGFVFLGSTGHPSPARLSQDSFVGTHPVRLKPGSSWAIGPIAVACRIGATAVRCTNRSHHGFTITKSSYRAF
jgi:hypothetical protein